VGDCTMATPMHALFTKVQRQMTEIGTGCIINAINAGEVGSTDVAQPTVSSRAFYLGTHNARTTNDPLPCKLRLDVDIRCGDQ